MGEASIKKWEPKTWKPEYDRVVGYSFLGLSNEEVGARVGMGKQQVSNILNSVQGKAVMEILQARQKEKIERTMPEMLEEISKKAVERVYDLVHDDTLYSKSPFAVVDRSIAILKGVGHIRGEGSTPSTVNNNNVNIFQLPEELGNTLIDGLQKARELKKNRQLPPGKDVTDAA